MKIFKDCILVDDMDYELLKNYRWCISVGGYAVARDRKAGKVIYMHRLILDAQKGQFTDHINGNRIDNRRSNLRLCSPAQNAKNQGIKINNTTGYKGVSFDKKRGKFHAYIKIDYRRKHLGYFDSILDAAEAYRVGASKYHGEFARLV